MDRILNNNSKNSNKGIHTLNMITNQLMVISENEKEKEKETLADRKGKWFMFVACFINICGVMPMDISVYCIFKYLYVRLIMMLANGGRAQERVFVCVVYWLCMHRLFAIRLWLAFFFSVMFSILCVRICYCLLLLSMWMRLLRIYTQSLGHNHNKNNSTSALVLGEKLTFSDNATSTRYSTHIVFVAHNVVILYCA